MNEFDSNALIPQFEFTEALRLSVDERFSRCIDRLRELCADWDPDRTEYPPVPVDGASEDEVKMWEQSNGQRLPTEYRDFLRRCRYLEFDPGFSICGFGGNTVPPWVSDEHSPGHSYLVIGDYFRFADGDQLMIDLERDGHPVVVYLHEEAGAIIDYAPSFSLALWRFVNKG